MTDYTDLIARLVSAKKVLDNQGMSNLAKSCGLIAAADALEAQARRIAELEYDATYHESNDEVMMRDIEYYRARIAELEAALKETAFCLLAAVSLLERGGKKAAPSNKIFEQMLVDYKNGVERARAALGEK
jgi:hypothetical protein